MLVSKYKDYEDLPLFLNTVQVADILGVSQSVGYDLMHDPNFPSLRIGSRFVVPRDKFIVWADRQTGGDSFGS